MDQTYFKSKMKEMHKEMQEFKNFNSLQLLKAEIATLEKQLSTTFESCGNDTEIVEYICKEMRQLSAVQ